MSNSAELLDSLNFDPIASLVEQYHSLMELDAHMKEVMNVPEAFPNEKYSARTHIELQAQIRAVSEALLRYKHARVPETTVVDTSKIKPLQIVLTDQIVELKVHD